MQKIVTLVFMLCVASMSHAVVIIPPAPSVAASGYILLDANTGDVIAEQNALSGPVRVIKLARLEAPQECKKTQQSQKQGNRNKDQQ